MGKKVTLEDTLISHFSIINDFRSDINKKHKLIDIIAITLCAVICGFEYWEEIEEYGKMREQWFKTFLELPNGIPSHDRIRAVFIHLDPDKFESCFRNWISDILQDTRIQFINIDGKTSRNSIDKSKGKKAIHMISAWSSEYNLVLGQIKTSEKSNEITAIPQLIRTLDIQGSTITIDAMGCQKDIVKLISDKKGDYIIGLKGNQKRLSKKVKECYSKIEESQLSSYKEEEKKAHGRVEQREYYLMSVPGYFNEKYIWDNLQTIGKVVSHRLIDGTLTTEERYYISSLPESEIRKFEKGVRNHWSIENSLHWQLDVSFGDDASRKREGNAAQNFLLMKKITLNLLKNEKTKKAGIERKRRMACLDTGYLEKILTCTL